MKKIEQDISKSDQNVTNYNLDNCSIPDDASSFADDFNIHDSTDGGRYQEPKHCMLSMELWLEQILIVIRG